MEQTHGDVGKEMEKINWKPFLSLRFLLQRNAGGEYFHPICDEGVVHSNC